MFIVLWQLHIVLEINPNWIKLCYNTVSMVDEIKDVQDKKYEVYWFDGDHSRTGKHLDRLQGAGYPKIPPKKKHTFPLTPECLFVLVLASGTRRVQNLHPKMSTSTSCSRNHNDRPHMSTVKEKHLLAKCTCQIVVFCRRQSASSLLGTYSFAVLLVIAVG